MGWLVCLRGLVGLKVKAKQCSTMPAVAQSVSGDPPACIGMSGVGYPGLILPGSACIGFALSDDA